MEFVQKFTLPDLKVKNFTPSISPNFNSFSGKKHKTWVKMEKITPLAKILHCRRHWRHGQIPPLFRIRIDGTGIGLLCLHIMKKVLLIRNSILTDRLWKMELLSYWEVGVKLSKGIHFLTHVRNHYWGGWSKLFQYYVGVRAKWLQYFIDGVCPND